MSQNEIKNEMNNDNVTQENIEKTSSIIKGINAVVIPNIDETETKANIKETNFNKNESQYENNQSNFEQLNDKNINNENYNKINNENNIKNNQNDCNQYNNNNENNFNQFNQPNYEIDNKIIISHHKKIMKQLISYQIIIIQITIYIIQILILILIQIPNIIITSTSHQIYQITTKIKTRIIPQKLCIPPLRCFRRKILQKKGTVTTKKVLKIQ